MRPKQHKSTDEGDLFRARLDQIIDMKHELVRLAGKLDWVWLDEQVAPLTREATSRDGEPKAACKLPEGQYIGRPCQD